jgi:hypothetical protein
VVAGTKSRKGKRLSSSTRLILAGRLVPRLFAAGKDRVVLAHQCSKHPAGQLDTEFYRLVPVSKVFGRFAVRIARIRQVAIRSEGPSLGQSGRCS